MADITIDLLNAEPATEEFAANDDFTPTYPTHDTQAARLLAAVLLGQKINPLRGWITLGIYRLSDSKLRLKKKGWPIDTGHFDVSNQFGELCHVANYLLPQWAIDSAGEKGRAFAEHEIALMNTKRAA